MVKRRSNTLYTAVAAAAWLMPSEATAQVVPVDAAGQSEATGGEIVVTAEKREQRQIDVPQSVSVVTADALRAVHADRLDDFFTRVPSAAIDETQAGQPRLILRGINTGGDAATVATYVDETPYGSATGLANGGNLAPDLDPNDLARIEVLRGPQGTLYGANSLGGVLKYVTVAPRTDAVHASGQVGVESIDHGGIGFSMHAGLNLPVANTLAIQGSGFYRDDAGYISDPNHGPNVNHDLAYGGRFSALFRPTSGLTLRANVLIQNIDSDAPNAVDVSPATLMPTLGQYEQSHIVSQPSNVSYRVYNFTGTYDFGGAKLTSASSWGNLQQNEVVDGTAAFGTPASVTESVIQHRFTQELRLASSRPGLLDWTLGGYYTRERDVINENLGFNSATTGQVTLGGLELVNLPTFYREFAGFASGTIHFSKQFDLTVGGRYSHNKQSSAEIVGGLLVGPGFSFTGNSSDGVFTYSVAPAFHPNADTTIYARVAKGYRPGGPNVISPLAAGAVPRFFGPDTTVNYEIGAKSELIHRILSVDVTGFYIDWDKIQLLTSVLNVGVNINGGKARSKGIEFSSTLTPTKGLTLSANGAYVDAFLTQDVPGLGANAGAQLPYTAKYSGTLAADYEHSLGGEINGTAGISWRYTGSRQSGFATNHNPGAANGQYHLAAFSQIDAHAGVTFGHFRLDAFVRNLTDKRGILDIGSPISAENGAIAAAIVRPRSIGATLGFRY